MFRFLFALALTFCLFGANAAEPYGEWLLEQPRSSVLTLSFKQSAPLDDKIATSELGFICDQRDSSKNIAVILIPLDGSFENKRATIPVLIQKNSDQFDSSDLSQKWKNGTEYIYSESEADVDELASFLKASETNGVKSVHFFFPNDLGPGRKISSHVAINVSGFSDVFSVTARDFPPEMLLPELSRVYFTFFPPLGHPTPGEHRSSTGRQPNTFSV
jgi:hypothetical protein